MRTPLLALVVVFARVPEWVQQPLRTYYLYFADHLIDQIESGTAPWTQAWQPGEKALPRNVATGKAYRGGNWVWLASVAGMRGYQDERWGTYKQVEGLGG